jgi:DNA-binding LacI/PurR family transcriptional regulator
MISNTVQLLIHFGIVSISIGFLRAHTEQGMRIPDDLSIIDFDDRELC